MEHLLCARSQSLSVNNGWMYPLILRVILTIKRSWSRKKEIIALLFPPLTNIEKVTQERNK